MADGLEGQNVTTTVKRKRRRWMWVVGVLLVFLVWNYWPVASTITISPETTVITGPLNADGTVNYFQAIVDRYSEGVTPENNAAVLLVRALGPEMFEEEIRAESLAQLGLTEEGLEKDKPYLDKFTDFCRRQPSAKDVDVSDMEEILAELMRRPWTTEGYPLVVAWLEANEKPLSLIAEASRRERLYFPLIAQSDPPVMVAVLLPNLPGARLAAKALAARAMLRLGSGDIERAKEDIFAVRRLGRQLTAGRSLIEMLIGIAVDRVASTAERALIASGELTANDIRSTLRDRKALPEMPSLAVVLQFERYTILDCAMMLRRHGLKSLAGLGGQSDNHRPTVRLDLDWDKALTTGNDWWARHIDAIMAEDYAEHVRKARAHDERIEREYGDSDIDQALLLPAKIGFYGLGGRILKGVRTRCVTDMLVSALMPYLSKTRELWEMANAENDILSLALAAKLYKAEKGQWPAELAALAPEYVEAIPADRFTDEPLRYIRTDDGVTIYSLGPNMTDDAGLNYNESRADDVDGNAETDIPKDADDIAIALA